MNRFQQVFKKNKLNVIGMIHLEPLPGTPKYKNNFNFIVEKARHEANIYKKHNLDGVLVENMHDVPYIQNHFVGPEIVASISRICTEIKSIFNNKTPLGVQVLASANKQAIAISKACDLQFVRVEGFVFSHVADEGWTDACAGELLRYRRNIDADNVLIFTDIKKKHSSHSVTADTSLLDTAKAAEFFLSDGVIITGNATGDPVKKQDLDEVKKCNLPIIIGSGCTSENVLEYVGKCNAVIVGSHFKKDGKWYEKIEEENVKALMNKI